MPETAIVARPQHPRTPECSRGHHPKNSVGTVVAERERDDGLRMIAPPSGRKAGHGRVGTQALAWPGVRTVQPSRRRDCRFADIPPPLLLKRLLEGEGGCSRVTVSPTASSAQPRSAMTAPAVLRSAPRRPWGGGTRPALDGGTTSQRQ